MRESAGMEVPFGAGQGTYAVTRWPGADGVPTLLAAHGIAANSLAWAPVAAKLPDVDLDALLEGMLGPVMRKLRSACVAEAVRDDAADELRNQEVITAIRRLPVPATFLYAERGLMNEAVGLYRPDVVQAADLGALGIEVRFLPDTNHYSIVLGDDGAASVADAVRGLL